MKYFEELRELGVDVDAGLERVMGDESFYEMTLDMFLDSVDENPIELTDFDADDLETLIGRVHILKGLTGNLEMTPLFAGYMQALDLLRLNQPGKARKEYEQLLPVQEAIIKTFSRKQVLDMISTGQCGLFNPRLLDGFFSVEDRIHELYQELPESQYWQD